MATSAPGAQLAVRRQVLRQRRRVPKLRPLPRQREPRGAQLQYTADLRRIVAELNQAVVDVLLPQLPALIQAQTAGLPNQRQDAPTDDIEKAIQQLAGVFDQILANPRLRALAAFTGERVGAFNRAEFSKLAKAGLGVDPLGSEPGLADLAAAFTRDNVKLIKSIGTDQLADVEGIVLRGARRGRRVEEISKEIRQRFGVSRTRANLIARDQVSKFNGELAQTRQQDVGVTRYIWRTSLDERVRPRHAELEGTIQDWKKPPIVDSKTGRTAHPGEDFQCRCTAEPILDDVLAAAEGRPPVIPKSQEKGPVAAGRQRDPDRLSPADFTKSITKNDLRLLESWKSNAGYKKLRRIDAGEIAGSAADQKRLADFKQVLQRAPEYEGKMYRGLERLDPDVAARLATPGATIEAEAISSWSSSSKVADSFAEAIRGKVSVRYTVQSTRRGVVDARKALKRAQQPGIGDEKEVLVPRGAKYRVKSRKPVKNARGEVVRYNVTLEEID